MVVSGLNVVVTVETVVPREVNFVVVALCVVVPVGAVLTVVSTSWKQAKISSSSISMLSSSSGVEGTILIATAFILNSPVILLGSSDSSNT